MRLPRATLWLALAALTAFPAQADEPAQPGNAAIHYWCAAAELKRPATDQEQKILDYIEDWSKLPPKVFIERKDAVSFLEEDLEAGGAMDLLHVGAECPRCDFDTDRLTSDVWVPHLGVFRGLARRGWAAAVALEGQGHSLRAAQLRADLFQFSAHLCQCPRWIYAINGEAHLGQSVDRMGAFLARKPDIKALRVLMERINRIPARPLSFSRCWTYEAKYVPAVWKKEQRLTDQDLDGALRTPEESDYYYMLFGLHWKTAVQMLRSKKPEERQGLLDSWAAQFGDELNAAAKAADGPVTASEPRVRAWAERANRLAAPIQGNEATGNPLLAKMPDAVMHTYATFAEGNARLEMGRILCAAALCEAETGQYPASPDVLAKYLPNGLPKDPFTGKDFIYALEDGLPCVTAQPSASLRRELEAWDCRLSMGQMLRLQADYLKSYRNERQSPPSGAHD